jgi:hypothetical protein
VKASVVDKVKSKVRRFARHLGYKKGEISDAEIRDLLSRIRKNALKGKAAKANKYDAAPIKYQRKRKEGQHHTALGNILWTDIPTILEQAGSAKDVESFLKNKKRWKGRKLTPEGIKYAANQAKNLEKNPKELKYRKDLAAARQKIRLGTVKEGTKEWNEIHKKYGKDLKGYSIPHYRRYHVTKGKVFGPKLSSDKVTKVEKVHALTGPFTIEEIRDKNGNLVIPAEILPQNPTKRKKAIDRIVRKNKEFAKWYENWNKFMKTVGRNLSQNEIFKFKKIQAILSAQAGPQGNMRNFKNVVDLLESGKDIEPGKKEHGKSGIDAPTLKKIYDVWYGRETSTDLETLKEIYGDKVGAYMTAAINPQNPDAVVIDRHMPRLWGYDITWHKDGAWGRNTKKGGDPKFTIAPEVEQEIVADIKAAAKRNNMTSAGVQAALWYESRIPDVEASSYREAARLKPSDYLPDVLYKETLAQDLGKAVHYRNTVLDEGDFLLATPKPEGTEQATYSSFSRNDIQKRIDQHTEKNPYAEMVYFYEAGTKPEKQVQTSKKQVYNVDLGKYNIYDFVNDPLNMMKTVNQRLKNDPMAHQANIMANVVESAGYDGFAIQKTGGRWVLLHRKAAVDHAPVQANVGISDVVESKENLPQDIKKLAEISPERSRKFQKRIKEVSKNYPEVDLVRMQPAIAQFEGATSGQMEVSTAVSVRGPLPALRAYLSELGAEHAQRNVFLMHTNFNQGEPNGVYWQHKAKSEYKNSQDLQKVLEDKGLKEFNIVTDQQTGSLWIEQFVPNEDSALDIFTDVMKTVADPYFPRNRNWEVHSEVLGDADFTGDFNNALEGYKKNLTEYFGKEKGEQRYAEALQRREKYLQEFEETYDDGGSQRGTGKVHREQTGQTSEELGQGNLQEVINQVRDSQKPLNLDLKSSDVKFKRTKIKNAKDLQNRWKEVGVDNTIKEDAGTVDLMKLEVPERHQGKGVGSKFMNEFLQYTDHKKKRATLLASGLGPKATKAQARKLKDWYEKFGFQITSAEEDGSGFWMERPVPGHRPVDPSTLKFKRKSLKELAKTQSQKETADLLDLSKKRVDKTVSIVKKWSMDNLITQVADELHPLKVLQQNIEKKTGKEINTSQDAYKSMRMLTNFPAIFGNFLHTGEITYDEKTHWVASGTNESGILSVVKALGENVDNFFSRVQAKSAQEMLKKHGDRFTDKKSIYGAEKDDAEVIRDVFEMTEAQYQENKEVWNWAEDQLQKINKQVLDLMERSGTIDSETRKEWERDIYIPFSRVYENEAGEFEHMFPNSTKDDVKSIFRMEGSKLRAGDPLGNLLNTYQFVLNEALKNVSRKKALKLMKDFGEAKKVKTFPGDKRKLVGIRHKGKNLWYKVDDQMLMDAIADLDHDSKGKFSVVLDKLLRPAKKFLTYSVTIAPGFRVRNAIRDTMHTSLMQKSFVPFVDTARGFYHAWKDSPWMKEFASTGGSFVGAYHRRDIVGGQSQKQLERVKSKMTERSTKNFFKGIYNWWDRVGEASENAARLGLYMKLRKEGKSAFESGYEAKDLLDFHMSGKASWLRFLTKTVPFLNARIQGLYKLGRTATNKKTRKNLLFRGMLMTAASLAIYGMNGDDERYQELPDWSKAQYWHFWLGDHHLKLPVPFEVGSMFGVMPTALAEYADGQRSKEGLQSIAAHVLFETLNFNVIPQFFKPMAAQGYNKDFFTGIPIVGTYEKRLEGPMQYGPRTSLTAKLIADIAHNMGMEHVPMLKVLESPKRVDQLIKDYTAYLGYLGTGLMDMGIAWITDAPSDPAASDKVKYLSGISSVYEGSDDVPRHTKSEERFYDLWAEVDEVYATLREKKKMRNMSEYRRYRQAHMMEFRQHKHLSNVQNRVRTLNRKMDMIHFQKGLSRKQKKSRIDNLLQKRHALIKRAMRRVKK